MKSIWSKVNILDALELYKKNPNLSGARFYPILDTTEEAVTAYIERCKKDWRKFDHQRLMELLEWFKEYYDKNISDDKKSSGIIDFLMKQDEKFFDKVYVVSDASYMTTRIYINESQARVSEMEYYEDRPCKIIFSQTEKSLEDIIEEILKIHREYEYLILHIPFRFSTARTKKGFLKAIEDKWIWDLINDFDLDYLDHYPEE